MFRWIYKNLEFSYWRITKKIKIGVEIIRGGDIRNNLIKILCSISLWNNKYLIAACNNVIDFIDMESEIIVKKINENNVITVQKIIHPKFGECLISQGNESSSIKLWIIKNDF